MNVRWLLPAWLLVTLALAGALEASPSVRLRYEVKASLELFYPAPDAEHRCREVRKVFEAVGVSPLVATELRVSLGSGRFEFIFIGFDKLEVIVESDRRTANVTLIFRNYTVVYRKDLANAGDRLRDLLELLTGGLELGEVEGFTYATARVKAIAFTLQPDRAAPNGEWLFWLNPGELKLNATVVLAHIVPVPVSLDGLVLDGFANLVYVNFSMVSGKSYVLNDGAVIVDRSRTAVGDSRYSEEYGRVFELKDRDIEQVRQRVPLGFRFVDFGNGTYAFVRAYVYETYELVKGLKLWSLTKVGRAALRASGEPYTEIVGVIELGGARYQVAPYEPVSLVYDKATGVLLESSPEALTPEAPRLSLFYRTHGILPPPLANIFGADTMWCSIGEGGFWLPTLVLVESSLHREEGRPGGLSAVDAAALLAALLAAALLAITLLVRRRRRRS